MCDLEDARLERLNDREESWLVTEALRLDLAGEFRVLPLEEGHKDVAIPSRETKLAFFTVVVPVVLGESASGFGPLERGDGFDLVHHVMGHEQRRLMRRRRYPGR